MKSFLEVKKIYSKYNEAKESIRSRSYSSFSLSDAQKKARLIVAIVLGVIGLIGTFLIFKIPGLTVYITNTGAKYHLSSCHYLKYSKISTTIGDATRHGYDLCKNCSWKILFYSLLGGATSFGLVFLLVHLFLLSKENINNRKLASETEKNENFLFDALIPFSADDFDKKTFDPKLYSEICNELNTIQKRKAEIKQREDLILKQKEEKQELRRKQKGMNILYILTFPLILIMSLINTVVEIVIYLVVGIFINPIKGAINEHSILIALLFPLHAFNTIVLSPIMIFSNIFGFCIYFHDNLVESKSYFKAIVFAYKESFTNTTNFVAGLIK